MTYFVDDFENTVRQFPEAVAVVTESGESRTYYELNVDANRLSHALLSKGVKPNTCVAINLERSTNLLVSIIACWKIHAGVVLISTHSQNKEAIKEQCGASHVILLSEGQTEFSSDKNVLIDRVYAQSYKISNPKRDPDANNTLAYYISTSGTTRAPKWLAIAHTKGKGSGLSGVWESIAEVMHFTADDTVLWSTPIGWDPLYCDLGILLQGGSLYIPQPCELANPEKLYANCAKHQVNCMIHVPNTIEELKAYAVSFMAIHHLKVLTTGEALGHAHIQILESLGAKLVINAYGPSEGPIGLTATPCDSKNPISIGRVMKGREIDIVVLDNAKYRFAKPGEKGELVYSTQGFEGYRNNAAATEDRRLYQTDGTPFLLNGKSCWHTGDSASFVANTTGERALDQYGDPLMQMHGRIDKSMVKIKGVRIEVAHIEDVLLAHAGVGEVHTLLTKNQNGESRLVSFVSIKPDQQRPSVSDLERWLHQGHDRLFMHQIVVLKPGDAFSQYPTSNKKLDEKKLLKSYQAEIAPKSADKIQDRIIEYWQRIVGASALNADSNFYECGEFRPSSLHETWLRQLIEDDPYLDVKVDAQMWQSFKNQPTIACLESLIRDNQSFTDRVTYYDIDRDTYPVFMIGDFSKSEIKNISCKQPVICIKVKNENETASSVARVIKKCRSSAPYFCVVSANTIDVDALKWILSLEHPNGYVWCRPMGSLLHVSGSLFSSLAIEHEVYITSEKMIRLHGLDFKIQIDCASLIKEDFLRETFLKIGMNVADISRLRYHTQPYTFFYHNIQSVAQFISILKDPVLVELVSDTLFTHHHRWRFHFTFDARVGIDDDRVQQLTNMANLLLGPKAFIGVYQPGKLTLQKTEKRSYQQPSFTTLSYQQLLKLTNLYHLDGANAPLLLFPALTGEDTYELLASRLPSDQPVISFMHPLLMGISGDFSTIALLAKFYVSLITAVLPNTDFAVAGWSFGGILAIEVGRQLRALNRNVVYIGLIDTPSPKIIYPDVDNLYHLLRWICNTYAIPESDEILKSLKNSDRSSLKIVRQAWEDFLNYVENLIPKNKHVLTILRISKENYLTCLQYEYEDSDTEKCLYQATGDSPYYQMPCDESLGWELTDFMISDPFRDPGSHTKVAISASATVQGASHFTIIDQDDGNALATPLYRHLSHRTSSMSGGLNDKLKVFINYTLESYNVSHYKSVQQCIEKPLDTRQSWVILKSRDSMFVNLFDELQHALLATFYRDDYYQGKPSVIALDLCRQFSIRHLGSAENIEVVPFYYYVPDNTSIENFFEQLFLTDTQRIALFQKKLVMIIDGLEYLSEAELKKIIDYLSPDNHPNIQFIFCCDQEYYLKNKSLSTYINWLCNPGICNELSSKTHKSVIYPGLHSNPVFKRNHSDTTFKLMYFILSELKGLFASSGDNLVANEGKNATQGVLDLRNRLVCPVAVPILVFFGMLLMKFIYMQSSKTTETAGMLDSLLNHNVFGDHAEYCPFIEEEDSASISEVAHNCMRPYV